MRDIAHYAENYTGSNFEVYQVKYRKKMLFERLGRYPHRRILEIGCALDPLYNHLDDYEHLIIVEPAADFYQKAVVGAKGNPRVTCMQGFFEDKQSELRQYSYDIILLNALLHEVESPETFLQLVYKLCSNDTVVHVNVPNAKSFHRLLALEMGLVDSIYSKSAMQVRLQQQRIFDMDSLLEMTQSAGFVALDQGSYFIKPFTHGQMWEMMKGNIITDKMLDGFYAMTRYMPTLGSEIFVELKKKRN